MITYTMRKRAMRIYSAKHDRHAQPATYSHSVLIGNVRYAVYSDGSIRRVQA